MSIVHHVGLTKDLNLTKILSLIGILTTVAINPWFAYDPINLPKMLILSTGAAYLLGGLLMNLSLLVSSYWPLFLVSALFGASLAFSFFANSAPSYQQFWGVWGRSTGLLTYLAFIFLMLSAVMISSTASLSLIRISFDKLGYFITVYTLFQLMDLDPINWSQKLMIATLGNINFMSSFLGLTSISYLSRIVLERLSISSRFFYLVILLLNLYLIGVSQSIQGVGVFLAGLVFLLTYKFRQNFSFVSTVAVFVASLVSGLVVLFGTAGLGPLSMLRQETVIFRIDYWTAAINMLIANPLSGIGIDSYGDFYREYRTIEAVVRTGPQRVTNTAHNIFLDVFSGAGVFSGLMFLSIMALTLYSIFTALRANYQNFDLTAFSAMWLGFMVFCLISINQIGVGVWGFIFTGLVNGLVIRCRMEKSNTENSLSLDKVRLKRARNRKASAFASDGKSRASSKAIQVALSGVLAIAVGTLSLIPNVADARFVSAIRSSNLDLAMDVIESPGIQDFHIERLITALAEAGRSKESLELAQLLSKQNPQSWPAWVAIVSSGIATRDQRVRAANELFRLDPNNELVKKEINAVLFP
jgi:O-antigen ligase